ncbi:hypothetical protein M422DRAFT_263703 [Sphaerobolus stellatus SS14]|uniref:Uncharacterized protein n=1 Tax=Sphaerobolus stellatus (strain SS14) TaxID=990650 RepID=A0A0C9UY26_SPHS4|nr:hypothetical protein M422DRAFT_263703 [Sphaerobolus stellatus SS14]
MAFKAFCNRFSEPGISELEALRGVPCGVPVGDGLRGVTCAVNAFASEGKDKVITILGPKDEAVAYNPSVTIQPTLVYSSLGREFSFGEVFPVTKEDKDHMAAFLTKVPELVKTGAIKPNRVKLRKRALDRIEGGLAYIKEGKFNAEKLVYKI